MVAKHAEMQQDVTVQLIADEKAEPSRRVEPFHAPGDRLHLGLSRVVLGLHFGPIPSFGQL